MSDLGAASVLLGIKINRNRSLGHLQLGQDHYIKSTLVRFNMSQCNLTTTPADGIIDSSGTPLNLGGIHLHQELVGSFIYLVTCTRPDIVFAMMRLLCFMAKQTTTHFSAAKRLLRCLKGSMEKSPQYQKGRLELKGFADASYAWDQGSG
ncbi:unnamed protein product [Discosporangium mesarthrocarpum]